MRTFNIVIERDPPCGSGDRVNVLLLALQTPPNSAFDRTAGSHSLAAAGQTLYAYAKELTGFERREGVEDQRHQRLEVHHAIGWRTKKKHSERHC